MDLNAVMHIVLYYAHYVSGFEKKGHFAQTFFERTHAFK